jgi:ketosteroid isomerase-like protein
MSLPKTILYSISALVLGLTVSGTAQAANYADEKAQILKIENNMAVIPTAAEALKYFDTNIVLDDLTPGRTTGKKAVATLITAQFAAIKNVKVQILQMSVDADSNLAFAYSIQKITMTMIASNMELATIYRQVDCYRKIDGKWSLVYQNLSVPFDPSTGKAVLNDAP